MGVSRERTIEEIEAFEILSKARWPNGFICPRCESKDARRLDRRLSYQCNECRFQCRLLSGTCLEGSRIPIHRIIRVVRSIVENRQESWSNPGYWVGGGHGRKLKWVNPEKPEFLGFAGKIEVRELLDEPMLSTKSLGTAYRFQKKILKQCVNQSVYSKEPDHEKCFRALLVFLMKADS